MTQQVAIALGIPVLATIVTARVGALSRLRGPLLAELNGVHVALAVDVGVTLPDAAAIWYGLRPSERQP